MKAALLKRLKRLEEVQASENLPPPEYQTGYLTELPHEYTGDRHIVTVGRDANGLYHWEERPGPEPDEGKRNFPPPFRVVLTSPEDVPPAAGAA
jgi:hypothetical protein